MAKINYNIIIAKIKKEALTMHFCTFVNTKMRCGSA